MIVQNWYIVLAYVLEYISVTLLQEHVYEE